MKYLVPIIFLSLIVTSAFASSKDYFFECEGLSDTPEYRVGINLKTNKAGFFDNDSTSYMQLVDSKIMESYPPQTLLIFEGKESSYSGKLKLFFNLTKKKVSLYSIDKLERSTEIGSATCVNAEPWDDLE